MKSDDLQKQELENSGPPGRTHYAPEPDFGAADYLRLPHFGIFHYSLTDAALLGALDMWSAGAVPDVPAEGWEDDEGPHDDIDDPQIRAALEPLRAELASALIRSAESGHLAVEVRGRNRQTSSLIPERTFVELHDFVDWLEVHGHERGDFIADIEETLADDPWRVASEVAEDRARLRLGEYGARPPAQGRSLADLSVEGLKQELQAKRLHIVHLEQQLDVARGGRSTEKRLSTRERRTLHTVIAALCKKAGIDPTARGAAMAIESATAELGVPVGDDSIRSILKAIPDALESRTR